MCGGCAGLFAGKPAPTGTAQHSEVALCGSGHAREHGRSPCHPLRRLLRVLARSHRYRAGCGPTLYVWISSVPRLQVTRIQLILGLFCPGILCSSAAQAPRSISLQRSEQNGRNALFSFHSTGAPQVGQSTVNGWLMAGLLSKSGKSGAGGQSAHAARPGRRR